MPQSRVSLRRLPGALMDALVCKFVLSIVMASASSRTEREEIHHESKITQM